MAVYLKAEERAVSNAIIKQQGSRPVVADNLWEFRLGAVPFALGLLAGVAVANRARGRTRPPRGRAPTPTGWPVNFAHRGGIGVVPENTIEGFGEVTATMDVVLELDVNLSADGVVVVIHDDQVDRTTDGHGPVAEMTLAELQQLDAGYRFTTDGGATYPWRGRGVQVPTLEAVYRAFPDRPVNIELKGSRPDQEAAVWQVVRDAAAEDRTLVVSSASAPVKRFRRVSGGRVATAAAISEFATFWLLHWIGATGLLDAPFQALQPPDRYKGVRVVSPRLLRAAHAAGMRVDVWTIDEPADMRRLLGWGVDGIMTDRPDRLHQILTGS